MIFENAKRLRNTPTPAERILWMYLRNGINNFKIRRQHPIGLYIADFYCHEVKLIIELDGSIHDSPEKKELDKDRERDLEKWGYTIIRFANQEVISTSEEVIRIITENVLELNNLQKQNTPQIAESKSPL